MDSMKKEHAKFEGDEQQQQQHEQQQQDDQQHDQAAASSLQAIINSFVLLIGLGTLSSSYAIERCGWLGIFLLLLPAFIFWCGAGFMCKCMEQDSSLLSYQDVAAKAFTKWGRPVITTFFYIRLAGSLVGYLVSMGDTLTHIFPHSNFHFLGFQDKSLFICISFCVILPTVWFRKLSSISYLSIWCPVSILLTLVCLVVAATKDGIGFHENVPFFEPKNIPVATGVYTFTFGGAALLPSVYRSCRNPRNFKKVTILSFSMASVLNIVFGVVGSLMFGHVTKAQVHLNMPRQLVASRIAIYATLLTPVTQFSLFLSPVSSELETLMMKYLPWKITSKLGITACLLLRSILLMFITLGALIFPHFASIIQLIGSSISVTLCAILPCVFYLRLFYDKLKSWEVAGLLAIIVVSALAGLLGTMVSIVDLIHKKRSL